MKTETQNKAILKSMANGCKLTATYALAEFGCFRLAARINDLRRQGYDVKDRWIKTPTNKRIKEYWLEA